MIVQVVGVGILVAILAIVVKKLSKDMGMLVSILGGLLIFFLILPYLSSVIDVLSTLADNINTDMTHINTIFRVLAVAYITEFGSQICKDAGEGTIASKIELGGKVIILAMSAPIIIAFLNLIINIL